MKKIESERTAQNKLVAFFQKELGYEYLGNWEERANNACIEREWLEKFWDKKGYSPRLRQKAWNELQKVANGFYQDLYYANKAMYEVLRSGIKVNADIGENKETVHLIDWGNADNNYFGIAEEVTIYEQGKRRPDLVLYVNGLALGVIELKKATVQVTEAISQLISNQDKEFNPQFFRTVQLLVAGNDTQGVHYGVIDTEMKYYLQWKNPALPAHKLQENIQEMFEKKRFLELIHDFVVFDGGKKKIARPHQYFGIKAVQASLKKREGGIIWHTQGSGKSLTMVLLAKWIRASLTNSRVLIVTDREDLDGQIETVFGDTDQKVYRAPSGADLLEKLNETKETLLCSLIHKFGKRASLKENDSYADFLAQLKNNLPKNFVAKGDVYVFIDECHRTQSGKLHDAMKGIIPQAVFIGFTGTPLLKDDKHITVGKFGNYLHTYKYDEAVKDNVVLDLRYEARDIEQNLSSSKNIDKWFELKTQGLTELAKAKLKERWGTLKSLYSADARLRKIVQDIVMDMQTKPRLSNHTGNAILVSDSIYNACNLYNLFQQTELRGKCAIITSFDPSSKSQISKDYTGDILTEKLLQFETYQKMLADMKVEIDEEEFKKNGIKKEKSEEDTKKNQLKIEVFEARVKNQFKKEPAKMKLLIVVDKLLTGFDAPPCTYLYIDKSMKDHTLFQAICRVNRLDTPDKEYGYIIDYRDLFKSLEQSVKNYTENAFEGFDKNDIAGLLSDRLAKGKERLEEALKNVRNLCELVRPPKELDQYLAYFCGEESESTTQIKKRKMLYQYTNVLQSAFFDIVGELVQVGYNTQTVEKLRKEIKHYTDMKEAIKIHSKDAIDFKQYDASMRYLIDTYISAEDSEVISNFDDMPLVQLIVEQGAEKAVEQLPSAFKGKQEAIAETIENNVRSLIINEHATNPKYFDKMSVLLEELVKERKNHALEYQQYLKRIEELSRQVYQRNETTNKYPQSINTSAKRALYDNLDEMADKAEVVNQLCEEIAEWVPTDWRGNTMKEKKLNNIVKKYIPHEQVEKIMEIINKQPTL